MTSSPTQDPVPFSGFVPGSLLLQSRWQLRSLFSPASPPTPLPLEGFDCVLALRRFSLPSVTPNAARLWREREKENRKERTGLFQRTNFLLGELRSQTKGQLDLTFLPFTKKTNSSAVIVTGWGVGPLPPGASLPRGTSSYGHLTTWKLHLPIK